jgi:hypothetical protein
MNVARRFDALHSCIAKSRWDNIKKKDSVGKMSDMERKLTSAEGQKVNFFDGIVDAD